MTICAIPTCNNPVPENKKRKRPKLYCCDAHRQKAYRLRKKPPNRNTSSVTVNRYDQITKAIDSLPIDQLVALQKQIDQLIQDRDEIGAQEPLLYFRKGSGVTHLAVSRNVTLCGRETASMHETTEHDRICSRCSKIRDRGTWWKTWRNVFNED